MIEELVNVTDIKLIHGQMSYMNMHSSPNHPNEDTCYYRYKGATQRNSSVSFYDCPSKSNRMFSVHKRMRSLLYGTGIGEVKSIVGIVTGSPLFHVRGGC